MTTTTLGQRIRKVRVDAGLSQQTLAVATGVSLRAVSYWETDARSPSHEPLKRISGLTGCDLWWLLHGTGFEPGAPTTPSLRHRVEKKPEAVAETVAGPRKEAERAG